MIIAYFKLCYFLYFTEMNANQPRFASTNYNNATFSDVSVMSSNIESAIGEPTKQFAKTEQVNVPIVSLNKFNNECLLQDQLYKLSKVLQLLQTEQGFIVHFYIIAMFI